MHFSFLTTTMKKKMSTLKASADPLVSTNHTTGTEECNSLESESQASFSSFNYDDNKKRVQFVCDQNGEDLVDLHIVENFSDYAELWWSQDMLRKIKSDCHEIATRFRQNEDFCEAVVDILMHGVRCNKSSADVKNFLNQMTVCSDARGLEPHIVSPCKKLAEIHYDKVFDAQQKAYDKGLYGTDKGDWAVCQASIQTSRKFEYLALRQAQFDTREAMRAAFTRWNSETTLKESKQRTRRGMMSRSASVQNVYL